MKILKTKLKDVYEIVPEPNQDERGFFQRLFCSRIFKKNKLENKIVQINNSFSSKKGTTRGLHYQIGNAKECKILRCVKGSLVNIVVDVRKNSKNYLKHTLIKLSGKKRKTRKAGMDRKEEVKSVLKDWKPVEGKGSLPEIPADKIATKVKETEYKEFQELLREIEEEERMEREEREIEEDIRRRGRYGELW